MPDYYPLRLLNFITRHRINGIKADIGAREEHIAHIDFACASIALGSAPTCVCVS